MSLSSDLSTYPSLYPPLHFLIFHPNPPPAPFPHISFSQSYLARPTSATVCHLEMSVPVVFLGDVRVGKTTIINLIRGIGDVAPYPTKLPSQLDYTLGDITFAIKDNSGRPEYQGTTHVFIQESAIFVLVYAQDDARSLEPLAGYIDKVKKVSKKPNTQFIILANKKDRAKPGLADKGREKAAEIGAEFIETIATASTKEGLEEFKAALTAAAQKAQG
jgi:GTPase SAR1 family protein